MAELVGRIREGVLPPDPWTPVNEEPAGPAPAAAEAGAASTPPPGPAAPAEAWQPVSEEPADPWAVMGEAPAPESKPATASTGAPARFAQPLRVLKGLFTPTEKPEETTPQDTVATIPVAKQLGLSGADITTGDIDTAKNIGLSAGPGTITRRVPSAVSPPPPANYATAGTAQALADDLQTIRQSTVADKAEVGNTIRALPAEAQTPAIGEKLYHAAEDPAEYAKLTPEEKAISDQHLDPLRQEQFDLALEAKKLGGSDLVDDPNYMHRIAKGHAPTYDQPGSSYDPVTGTSKLPRTTSALQERAFYVIESPAGVRKVVTPNANGVTVWNNKVGTSVPTNGEIRPGEVIDINGQNWTVKSARTKEIEQHGQFSGNKPAEYHKNAFVNTADAVVRLREVVRNLKFLEEVKKSPWWLQHAQSVRGNAKVPEGWVRPKMPQLHDWWVDPKIAHVLDDFYQPGILDPNNALRKTNQFATSSMFWNPIGHMQNVGVHWSVARGWDWIRPSVMKHFAKDMTQAIKATVTQNHDYQKYLREGGGLVYGGVKNADFYGDLGRQLGMDIEKHWGAWKPLFNKLGLKTPYEAIAWWYGKMRETLWASSDMFMMHRYLELERKGYSPARAIKEAEKHIPNYRIPTTIMGSRTASQFAQEPAFTNFSRYHYGMWKSFMHMATDLAKGTKAEKKEALGNVAALAVMGYVIYPIVDWLYQQITGDPNAKMFRRGAMSVPHGLAEVSRDRQSFSQFLGSNITAAPATKEILQQFFGKDFFTGREISGVVPRTEHAAKALLSPYGTAAQMTTSGEDTRSAGRTALDTTIGGENTSEKTEKGKQYGAHLRATEERRHEEKPQGPIEKLYYGAKSAAGLSAPPKEKKAKKSHHNKEKGY